MSEWFFRKKSKGEVERDPGWDEYFTSNRSTDESDVDLMGDNVIIKGDQFDIRSVIYTIRDVQVMLDRDLAAAYQVTTSVFNQAVKRNANRFPEGFRFQLSKEENEVLISQIVTSKRNAGQETRGGYHKLPYAFTLIIIDSAEIYAIGASLKDAGRLTFGVSKMGDSVIPGLLANLRNATSARKEYAK